VKLKHIASLFQGEIIGDQTLEITGVSGIHDAKEGEITFLASKKYLKDLEKSKVSCILVKEPLSDLPVTQLKVKNPHLVFAKLLELYYIKPFQPTGVSEHAIVSETAHIAENVSVYPFSYISDGVTIEEHTIVYPYVFIGNNTRVGERCVLYPHVTLREGVRIGSNVIIHSGSVIGSDGFGYIMEDGKHHKIPQIGGVIIEDDVEIGSNVSIDRATTGNTIIGSGTKIDNLVQIGHNVKIGSNSIVVAHVGIGGSTEIGDFVMLGGQAGVSDHAKIESQTMIGAQAGIMGTVTKGVYSGSPAIPHRDWLKAQAVFAKLPEMHKKIKELEDKIRELERSKPQ
jgi:UDP-3-O-[3-hydroxymyristoyl] glucosamine N-acyltransferase